MLPWPPPYAGLLLMLHEPGQNTLAHTFAGMAKVTDFFSRTPTLTASNYAAL